VQVIGYTTAMDTVLGQDHALDILRKALRTGRMHHAWIFAGPRGVGKFTTALELAKILLDPAAAPDLHGNLRADPDSPVVHHIDSETHPDLHIIRKELALYSSNPQLRSRKLMNIPLDLLRERMLGGKTGDDRTHEAAAYRTPALGHGKVFIIDEAELLDQYAQNALLKTLEEPPAQTYVFLITRRPERLLPTIRSRCQHVSFGTLSDDAMQQWCDRANLDVDPEELRWILTFAGGAPGMVMTAIDCGFAQWHHMLQPMLTQLHQRQFPAPMGEAMARLVDDFAKHWVETHDNASKDAANKDGLRYLLTMLADDLRRRMHRHADEPEALRVYAELLDVIRSAEYQAEANTNLKHLLENLVVQQSRILANA
jgi:DNA polymerase-3 subunit delta'